jgi:hypothetical protein
MGSAPILRAPVIPPPPLGLPNRPAWELPLRLIPPSCPVDHLLIGIVQNLRGLIAAGASEAEVLGPYHPSLRIIAYPDQSEDGNALSTLIANLLQRTQLIGLPEKAACMFVMYHLAQWQIAPSPETYSNLPEFHKPRASQLLTPHPIWASQITFGKLRDRVIANQETYATEEFQVLYTASLRINWSKDPMDILVFEENDVRVSDEFARHCTTMANWSIGEPFSRRYPELADCCTFATDQYVPQMNQEALRQY